MTINKNFFETRNSCTSFTWFIIFCELLC